LRLAKRVPSERTLIALADVDDAAAADVLRGVVDAIVIGKLLDGADVPAVLTRLASGEA
jgi:hypothetical protein